MKQKIRVPLTICGQEIEINVEISIVVTAEPQTANYIVSAKMLTTDTKIVRRVLKALDKARRKQ